MPSPTAELIEREPDDGPTLQQVKDVMDEVDELDLPDGAHWAMVHERLGLEYGDVFDIIGSNLEFFGAIETKEDNGGT